MFQYQPTRALEELVHGLHQSVAVDKIFLLGVMAEGRAVNSIFNPTDHRGMPAAAYFMLLLTRPGEKRTEDSIQDMLEQRSRYHLPVHLIVYPVGSFYQWLTEGQSFAVRVIEWAPLLYDARITQIPPPGFCFREDHLFRQKQQAFRGYKRSGEFLAGAELYALRHEFNLAAFLLHQAAEHACLSYMLQHTGLRTGTHNIDKLLRYSTMVSNQVSHFFPRNTEADIELFRLLQKAYIHARYKDDYTISSLQVNVLIRRMKKLLLRLCPEATEGGLQVEEETLPWGYLSSQYN
ncbi:MAG: HEPN domain-containing protein [Pseudobacter sp.]|uniref:HEPN domain-containing protein n=1 Tax=Pseudobacter sp. TaxID=2045420 RepID=UPI003F7D47A9